MKKIKAILQCTCTGSASGLLVVMGMWPVVNCEGRRDVLFNFRQVLSRTFGPSNHQNPCRCQKGCHCSGYVVRFGPSNRHSLQAQ